MTEAVLAVDLGGTQMRAAIVQSDGYVLDRRAEPTPQDAECPESLFDLTADVLRSHQVSSAVVAVPGLVDYRAGRLEHAPNLPAQWVPHLDRRSLHTRLGVPVDLVNDADAAAVGEATFGAGRGADDIVYLTVSTGIGAGVLLGGRLVGGTRSIAEAGHTVIDLRAEQDGRPATLEELGSGTALARAARAAGLPPDGADVLSLVHSGNQLARQAWDAVVTAVTVGARNLVHLFSPQIVVLGGGVGRTDDLLLPVRAALAAGAGHSVRVVAASLGDDAGLMGAAAWRDAAPHLASR